jgi:hypothetical protein
MGRPLNKRYLATAAAGPQAAGDEIKVQFHDGVSSKAGWIAKQTGSRRFVCTDGAATATCYLTDAVSGSLTAGQMSITLKLDDTTVVRAVKIAGRVITANDGARYPWNFSTSTADGAAQVEEAGDDAVIDNTTTDEDDFEGDDPAP